MAFVKFTDVGKSFVPKISINNRGLISFNQGACKRFGLEKFKAAVAYYDAESRRIGLEFVTEENLEGAIKLRHRSIGADIAAKSFLAFFNLLPKEIMVFPVDMNERNNWIELELSKGVERKVRSRS